MIFRIGQFLASSFLVFLFALPAFSRETISPPYLWKPTRSAFRVRLIYCDQGTPIQTSIYRNMEYRYFAPSTPGGKDFSVPLRYKMTDLPNRSRRYTFTAIHEGSEVLYADLLFTPGHPIRKIGADGQLSDCKSYLFLSEFVQKRR
jgi:hypothetical protein